MSYVERLESLKSKHRALEDRVQKETSRPLPDTLTLKRLKLEKLKIKEEIARLSRA